MGIGLNELLALFALVVVVVVVGGLGTGTWLRLRRTPPLDGPQAERRAEDNSRLGHTSIRPDEQQKATKAAPLSTAVDDAVDE